VGDGDFAVEVPALGGKSLAARTSHTSHNDITSFSSCSEGSADTEWGYNRDEKRPPQINMGLYLRQTSPLPLFYAT
jgi:transposase